MDESVLFYNSILKDSNSEFFFSYLLEDKLSGSSNKRQKIAQDFFSSIDQTGELMAMFENDEIDEVKQERMEVWYILHFLE